MAQNASWMMAIVVAIKSCNWKSRTHTYFYLCKTGRWKSSVTQYVETFFYIFCANFAHNVYTLRVVFCFYISASVLVCSFTTVTLCFGQQFCVFSCVFDFFSESWDSLNRVYYNFCYFSLNRGRQKLSTTATTTKRGNIKLF